MAVLSAQWPFVSQTGTLEIYLTKSCCEWHSVVPLTLSWVDSVHLPTRSWASWKPGLWDPISCIISSQLNAYTNEQMILYHSNLSSRFLQSQTLDLYPFLRQGFMNLRLTSKSLCSQTFSIWSSCFHILSASIIEHMSLCPILCGAGGWTWAICACKASIWSTSSYPQTSSQFSVLMREKQKQASGKQETNFLHICSICLCH